MGETFPTGAGSVGDSASSSWTWLHPAKKSATTPAITHTDRLRTMPALPRRFYKLLEEYAAKWPSLQHISPRNPPMTTRYCGAAFGDPNLSLLAESKRAVILNPSVSKAGEDSTGIDHG
jgi:hypothetical protein